MIRKLDKIDKEEIVRLFKDDNSVKEIVLRFNISNKRVSEILREYIKYGEESFFFKKAGRKSLDSLSEKDKKSDMKDHN